MQDLLKIEWNSNAISKNNILTEGNPSGIVYLLFSVSRIQMLNVIFTRDNLMRDLLKMESNFTTVIKNNILTQKKVSRKVYPLCSMSSIQLLNATFTRNDLIQDMLIMQSYSAAIIKNNIVKSSIFTFQHDLHPAPLSNIYPKQSHARLAGNTLKFHRYVLK